MGIAFLIVHYAAKREKQNPDLRQGLKIKEKGQKKIKIKV